MDPKYEPLFQPIAIGPRIARNRFLAAAHSAGMGYAMPHSTAALRAMKAEGGWGIVCTGVCEIDATSDMMGHQNLNTFLAVYRHMLDPVVNGASTLLTDVWGDEDVA